MEKKSKLIFAVSVTAIISFLVSGIFHSILFRVRHGLVIDKVSTVKTLIEDYGIFESDEETMADYASMGLAAAVGDPYTMYFPKTEFTARMDSLQSVYVGVGATIGADVENDCLVVVSPMDNSPAEKAGVLAGDILLAVDGEVYKSAQISEAAYSMKNGDVGTTVTVTLKRGESEPFDVVITREKIEKETVTSKLMEDDIGYIRISEFDTTDGEVGTAKEFEDNYNGLQAAGAKKLIIDLRNNPGGEFGSVCDIADMLLPEGIITYTEDKRGKKEIVESDKKCCEMPMVVLVNGGSASASEVLTGALKDHKKATVVGTKTFGKGIVQTVIPLTDGSGMSITTSRYFTPNGTCIHDIGIQSDVVVEMETETAITKLEYSEDIQLQKAVEILKN